MTDQVVRGAPLRLGFWAAILTAVVAAISFGIAVTTLPISGPFCRTDCVTYPYSNVLANIPRDYLWMYPALLLAPIFVVLMVCIHHYAADSKKLYSQIGLCFAIIYAAFITFDYYTQITVIQSSLLKGESDGIALFTQYNPHGIFIALEDLGYLMMSLSFLFSSVVFAGGQRLERIIRWLFAGNGLLTIGALVVLGLSYGKDLEYRFEVFSLSINWIVAIISGVLLSIVFRRR